MRMRRRISVFYDNGFYRRSSIVLSPGISGYEPVIVSRPRKKHKKISNFKVRLAGWMHVLKNGFPRL